MLCSTAPGILHLYPKLFYPLKNISNVYRIDLLSLFLQKYVRSMFYMKKLSVLNIGITYVCDQQCKSSVLTTVSYLCPWG